MICFKVIFLGNSSVGKTTLIKRYTSNTFDQSLVPTITPSSVEIRRNTDSGIPVQLQIWDTAGQEKYLALTQNYYRGSVAAVVCYEPGDVNSLRTWTERVLAFESDCAIFAVVTKIDCYDNSVMEDDCVAVRGVLEEFSAVHLHTSAQTGEGIEELLTRIAGLAEAFQQPEEIRALDIAKDDRNSSEYCC
jgi:small GTP-binding protein